MEGTAFGRYRLIDLLGRGGMGEVWRAFDTETQRVVALKVLPAHLASDPQFEQRFRREAFAAAGLAEPHVVPIHQFGEIDGRLYVDMRLIEGQDLQSILRSGPLAPDRAVAIVEQVASALHAAHRIGLVHRDVKPSNMLVAEDDFTYLIDFGIARTTGDSNLTGTGSVIGTMAYLAPERFSGEPTDARADIYALACVLHECLTGSQPFPGNSLERQVAGHVSMPPPRPSTVRADVPAAFDAVIARGMAKRPDDRYSTTKEMAKAARTAITGPIAARRPVPGPQPGSRFPGKAGSAGSFAPTAAGGSGPRPQGSFGPNDPTRYRPPTPPGGYPPPPQSPPPQSPPPQSPAPQGPLPQGPPSRSAGGAAAGRRRNYAVIAGVIGVIAVLVIAGVIVLFVVGGHRDEPLATSPSSATSTATTATPVPNTGPFTGIYTAAFGPKTDLDGSPRPDAGPTTERWDTRSACNAGTCVATASRVSGDTSLSTLVFDQVGNDWIAVGTDSGTCRNAPTDRFHILTLQPQPDGTLTGNFYIETGLGCIDKTTLTFTRDSDVDVANLPDPTEQAPRTVSPAEALHGQYHTHINSTAGYQQDYDYGVKTYCLRGGDRCISFFHGPSGSEPFVFQNGMWTRTDEYDTSCPSGGTSHVKFNAQYPLPQPPQDPITALSGHGFKQETGSACVSGDFDQTFARTGD